MSPLSTERAAGGAKVLFFSHDAKLGDAIVNTAFVAGLKRRDPACELHATVAGATAAFWERDGRIARLWQVQRPGWRETLRIGRALRGERFDYIVTWKRMRSEKNRLLLWLAGGRKVIDLDAFNQGPVRHQVEACAEALAQMERPPEGELAYDLRPGERCARLDAAYPAPREIILVNLSAADAERNLGHAQAVDLVRALHELAPQAALCLLCTGATEADARAVAGASGVADPVNCEGSLERLFWICQRASLVVSPDTAVVHIACAFGTPVVGIYQNNGVKPVQWGPRGGPSAVVLSQGPRTLNGFSVDEVVGRAALLRARSA